MSITINHQTNAISATSGSITIDGTIPQPQLVSGTNIKTINGTSLLGSGNWEIIKYSARKLELINAQETQLTISTNRYYPVGSKIRFNIWGDATITLRSSNLPGTVEGTVVLPAYRFLMA